MTENNEKAVSGGNMWNPDTYEDSIKAYKASMLAGIEKQKQVLAKNRRRQGSYAILLGFTVLAFISFVRINMVLSSATTSYYAIPDIQNLALMIISLSASVVLGWGAGTFVMGIPKSKFLLIPVVLILVFGASYAVPASAQGVANSNFSSWLESTHSLSSFVGDTPKIKELADEKVVMLNADGDKVSVTFSTKDDRVTVLDIEPVTKEEK